MQCEANSSLIMNTDTSPLILIVDDVAQNLQVLNATLSEHGYRVAASKSGEQAFKALERIRPDLILLDIMMPGMDGYTVCQRLKENPGTQNIPVIFLTAKSESEDMIKGFQCGGVDYITKPFQTPELLARVRTHTELKRNRDLILEYTLDLKERTIELERLNDEKNQFLGIASHDLKNPLGNILMLSQLMKTVKDEESQFDDFMAILERSAKKMLNIIDQLLDVNRIESGHLRVEQQNIPIDELIEQTVDAFAMAAKAKQIHVQVNLETVGMMIHTDPMLLSQVLDNLVSNAIKYSPKASTVTIALSRHRDSVHIAVRDHGPGFSAQDQERLYHKFARLTAQPTGGEHSTGLGLSIVKRLVEALDGEIRLESDLGKGSLFTVILPDSQKAV
jgi:two-component system, sensor histidine kinase and response regulator